MRKGPLLSQEHFERLRLEPTDIVSVSELGWKTEQFYENRFYAVRSSGFKSGKKV